MGGRTHFLVTLESYFPGGLLWRCRFFFFFSFFFFFLVRMSTCQNLSRDCSGTTSPMMRACVFFLVTPEVENFQGTIAALHVSVFFLVTPEVENFQGDYCGAACVCFSLFLSVCPQRVSTRDFSGTTGPNRIK